MSASKAEQVLDALRALLETVPGATIDRNSVLPEKIPDGRLIILRDGDPGEAEQSLGDRQVAGRGHRQELGEPLHDAQDDGVDETEAHFAPLRWTRRAVTTAARPRR